MSERTRTTLVFAHDIRGLKSNPFDMETPLGKPVVVCMGDECDRADRLEDICTAFAEAIEMRADEHRYADAMKLFEAEFGTPTRFPLKEKPPA